MHSPFHSSGTIWLLIHKYANVYSLYSGTASSSPRSRASLPVRLHPNCSLRCHFWRMPHKGQSTVHIIFFLLSTFYNRSLRGFHTSSGRLPVFPLASIALYLSLIHIVCISMSRCMPGSSVAQCCPATCSRTPVPSAGQMRIRDRADAVRDVRQEVKETPTAPTASHTRVCWRIPPTEDD